MKIKNLNRLQRFRLRFLIAWRLLWKGRHAVVIYISRDQLTELIKSEPKNIKYLDFSYCGMMEHHVYEIARRMHEMANPTDIILCKAEFEAEIEERLNNKNKSIDEG